MYFHFGAGEPPPDPEDPDPVELYAEYFNFGNGNATQPEGYVDAEVIYAVMPGYGWTNGGGGQPPQCFTRASNTDKLETACRVDCYYSGGWVDTGVAIIRWRVDVPNGTYDVTVGCGDPASFGQSHTATVEVTGDGGSSWVSVFDSEPQSSSISNTVTLNVLSGYLHFRFGEETATPAADRTALTYIDVEQM